MFKLRVGERARMEEDPDIRQESIPVGHPPVPAAAAKGGPSGACPFARFSVKDRKHIASPGTQQIIQSIGGLERLRKFTTSFYEKAISDPHLDQFIGSHDDPHAERFACWIAEKMGDGTPWSEERRTRKIRPISAGHGHVIDSPHDRSSAHFVAWHSPKRADSVWGQHFKLDDCRVWMRLHFWAAREQGLLETPAFADYYTRFIAHFVSVYERSARLFVRDSVRWSADEGNIRRYLGAGRRMPEIMDLSIQEAVATLPASERGSENRDWPWEDLA